MLLDLDKKALISLVRGESPAYSLLENSIIKRCGEISCEGWVWDENELERLNEEALYNLYLLCRGK